MSLENRLRSASRGEGRPDSRRGLVLGAAAATMAAAGTAEAQNRTDIAPRVLDGKPVPELGPGKSAGPVRPGHGSDLKGKVAVVTGAARGIGRAIAVELAATDVVALDIAGRVSTASNAVPATPEELAETVKQIPSYGRRAQAVRADIRDIAALRSSADQIEQTFGKVDMVVADAAIQR